MSLHHILYVLIAIIIGILIYRMASEASTEHFTTQLSGYERFANEDASSIVFGNPLIQRNGFNLEISNFGMNSVKTDIILHNKSSGLTALAYTATVKINLLTPKRITSIRTLGLSRYSVYYSQDGIKYMQAITSLSQPDGLVITTSSKDLQTAENILDLDTKQPVVAAYIKLVNSSDTNATGVKLEVYGLDASSIASKLELQRGSALTVQYLNESGQHVDKGHYIADPTNRSPFFLIRPVDSNGIGTDCLVNFITLRSNIAAFKIKYGHSMKNELYTVPCQGNFNGNVSPSTTECIYFNNPVMTNNITIIPLELCDKTAKQFEITELMLYGSVIDPSKKANYVEASKSKCSSKEGFSDLTVPYTSDLQLTNKDILSNMTTTQNICQVLENQDKIATEKIKMERNKQYLLKLKQQADEISALEGQINALQTSRESRIKNEDNLNLVRYQNQVGTEARVADLVNQRLANQEKLAVNVALLPGS